jgi:hypothetical protein
MKGYTDMSIFRSIFPLVSATALFVAAMGSARANTIYTYTGNDFTFFQDSTLTTSDFISASVTLASPLADNLSNANETGAALSWSITDQVSTINQASPDAAADLDLFFSTNATGAITSWEFNDTAGNCATNCLQLVTQDFPQFPGDDLDQSSACVNNTCGIPSANNDTTPGVWRATTASAPEPSGKALITLGGCLLLLRARRKRLTGISIVSQAGRRNES